MVGELASLRPMPATDKLPTTFTRLRPDFPSELRALAEPGYVIATRYIDAGRQTIEQGIHGTHALFEQSVQRASGRWILFEPAMRERKKIAAHIWVPVIFNPKSAGEKIPDATPRLLAVAPVFVAPPPDRPAEPFVVRVQLALDDAGAITAIAPAAKLGESLEDAIRASLQKWRFAPARVAGKAVAASLTMPVLCQPTPADYFKRVPPRVLSKSSLGYPMELNSSGFRADVVVGFEVDARGAVQNPVVISSTNPLFDTTALAAVREWKYAPATIDGEPVASEGLRAPFHYDTRSGGQDAFEFRDNVDQAKLPPNLRYDTPAKIRGALIAVYPYALRRAGTTGTARAVVVVDTRGHVGGVKILSADQPEFGRALAAALEGFSFDPALKDGQPVPYVLTCDKKFEPGGAPFDSSPSLLALEKNHPERIVAPTALDGPLKPLTRRPAVFPVALAKNVVAGEARVEVLVDEEGFVRLPRIVSATDEAFGYAAAQAVSVWQFERPRKDGKPAVVRAQIPFSFTMTETAAVKEVAK